MGETAGVEIATATDVVALTELRLRTGWYASAELLSALVEWERARILLVRASAVDPHSTNPAQVIASTSAIAAGGVGIVGNVAVDAEFRRRGLARTTTSAALEWLRRSGVRSALLDATKDGQPLYTHLGFTPLRRSWHLQVQLRRLERYQLAELAGATRSEVRHARDLALVRALDLAAYGSDRSELLALMLRSPNNWLVIARDSGAPWDEPSGYLVYGGLRDTLPSHSHPSIHLGPLVAKNQAAAAALLASVLREDAPWRRAVAPDVHEAVEIRAAVPGVADQILAFYRSVGLPLAEDDLIMQLDFGAQTPLGRYEPDQLKPMPELLPYPGDPALVYSWLAPMSF